MIRLKKASNVLLIEAVEYLKLPARIRPIPLLEGVDAFQVILKNSVSLGPGISAPTADDHDGDGDR